MISRVQLIPAHSLTSSYRKSNSINRWDISVFSAGGAQGNFITPDLFKSLQELDNIVKINNGTLYITDLFRTWDKQFNVRKLYETGIRNVYAAKPGHSFHNAGRAVDISISELNFSDIPKKEWLDKFWNLAIPLGFRPIIDNPDMNKSEAWHFDYPGDDWSEAYNNLSYSTVAKCCVLDVGQWFGSPESTSIAMFIQAQLIRLGFYDIGDVDGIIGYKTRTALLNLNLGNGRPALQAESLVRLQRADGAERLVV